MTQEDVPLGNEYHIATVRSMEGAHVEDFDVNQIPTKDSESSNHEFAVTEQSMGKLIGEVTIRNVGEESAETALQTPDGFTMSESLIRDVVPLAMEKAGVTKVKLDEKTTNIPSEKIKRSGFTEQDGHLTLRIA